MRCATCCGGDGVAMASVGPRFGPPVVRQVSGGGRRPTATSSASAKAPRPDPRDRRFTDAVWVVGDDGPDWMAGGTYLVLRHVLLDVAARED